MLNHSPITIQSQPAHNTKPFFSFLFKNTLPLLDYFKIKNRHFFKSKVFPETKQVGNPCRKSITFEKKFKKITAQKITFFFSKQIEIFSKSQRSNSIFKRWVFEFLYGNKSPNKVKTDIFQLSSARSIDNNLFNFFNECILSAFFSNIFFIQ